MRTSKIVRTNFPLLCLSILMISSCVGMNVSVSTESKNLLTIKHHRTVKLDETRIMKILKESLSAMRSNEHGDYDCNFKFNPVVIKEFVFPETPAIISSREDMKLVAREARESGKVMVVGAINWDCDDNDQNDGTLTADAGEVWGCSPTPGNFIVVEHQVADSVTEGILWLHEFGHNGGLKHTGTADEEHENIGPGRPFAVMNEWITKENNNLTEAECSRYRGV